MPLSSLRSSSFEEREFRTGRLTKPPPEEQMAKKNRWHERLFVLKEKRVNQYETVIVLQYYKKDQKSPNNLSK